MNAWAHVATETGFIQLWPVVDCVYVQCHGVENDRMRCILLQWGSQRWRLHTKELISLPSRFWHNEKYGKAPKPCAVSFLMIWLAPRAGKMTQIARCDWLSERARWSHLARSGLPAVPRKQNFPESHIIKPLLTKFARSRWLDIGLVLFLRVYGPRLRLGP